MAVYQINKGIGRSPEFKGLRSQYLFIFAGGLLAILIAFMVLYMAGVNQWICIALGVISASVLVWATFHLNAKYGEEDAGCKEPSPLHHQPQAILAIDYS